MSSLPYRSIKSVKIFRKNLDRSMTLAAMMMKNNEKITVVIAGMMLFNGLRLMSFSSFGSYLFSTHADDVPEPVRALDGSEQFPQDVFRS